MGLCLYVHDNATCSFSYGGFHKFRNCMLEALGLYPVPPYPDISALDRHYLELALSDRIDKHMRIFFKHSDSQGYIGPKTAKGILDFCLLNFRESDFDSIMPEQYLDFIEVLKAAHKTNSKVKFL